MQSFRCWHQWLCVLAIAVASSQRLGAEPLPIIEGIEFQPLAAQARRVAQTLETLGSPLTPERQAALEKALASTDAAQGVKAVQQVLDPLCLAIVNVNPESRVKASEGPAPKRLMQQGWQVFLVKLHNQAGVTAELACNSPNAAPLYRRSTNKPDPPLGIKPTEVGDRWMDVSMFNKQPMNPKLSGLELEYRIIELYSRDVGKREAKLMFDVGQGTQDLGFRNELNVLFQCEPAVEVVLDVIDDDGKPTTGQFIFRDVQNRVYPSRSRRLAPDLFFHDQVYRHSGESVMLPPGKYSVVFSRGPEYRIETRQIDVPNSVSHKEVFRLTRWIKLSDYGWYSGDHHVHAAGCAHYDSPAEGVQPVDMMRHILGEDLNVGCVLSWGPCWYYQKQFFDGSVHRLSTPNYLMRYDIEVSGFPSQHAGHLCLLRLKEDDYTYPKETEFDWSFSGVNGHFKGTKTDQIGQWPTWDLPILKWGKEQGAVVGFSHSGWGLKVGGSKLPTYEMPPFDGIGANEYIVDVVHDVCDFISSVDTPSVWELNIWYHTLNCGYTCKLSGETDFPCIYGDRVGLGRGYVKFKKGQPLDFDTWIYGIRDGRSYVCDGLSHLFDYQVNKLGVGEKGADGRPSVLASKSGGVLDISVRAASLLEEKPRDDIRSKALDQKPYWHVERARIGETRKVPVELIVNGESVETQEIVADGKVNDVKFKFTPKQSSWVAVRIFPSAHTNPVFVEVDGKPIRASKRSAEWCLKAVDTCWTQKVKNTRESEKEAAAAAYEVARQAYRRISGESTAD